VIDASPFYASEKVRYVHVGANMRSMYKHAAERFPPVVHPLVFTQPETGRAMPSMSEVSGASCLT